MKGGSPVISIVNRLQRYSVDGIPINAAYVYDALTGIRIEPNRIYDSGNDQIISYALIYEL